MANMNDASGMSPRKQMAGGDMTNSTFGCESHDSWNKTNPEINTDLHKRTIKDDDRGAGKPIKHSAGKFPAQSNADHGRHDAAHGPDWGRVGK